MNPKTAAQKVFSKIQALEYHHALVVRGQANSWGQGFVDYKDLIFDDTRYKPYVEISSYSDHRYRLGWYNEAGDLYFQLSALSNFSAPRLICFRVLTKKFLFFKRRQFEEILRYEETEEFPVIINSDITKFENNASKMLQDITDQINAEEKRQAQIKRDNESFLFGAKDSSISKAEPVPSNVSISKAKP